MIGTSLDLLRSSSAIFCNFQSSSETARKLSGNVRKRLSGLLGILENLRKSLKNPQKPKTTASKYDPERPKNSQGCAKMF